MIPNIGHRLNVAATFSETKHLWKREGAPASSRPFSSVIKGPEAKAEKERGLALVHALSLSLSLYSLLFSVRSICGDLDVGWRRELVEEEEKEAASVQRGHSSLSRSCAAVLCQF